MRLLCVLSMQHIYKKNTLLFLNLTFKPLPEHECFITREFKYYASNLKNGLWLNIAQQWNKNNKSSWIERNKKRELIYFSEHCEFMNN